LEEYYYYLYIYNKTSIKRNILTIKKIHREVGRAKDLSAPLYFFEELHFWNCKSPLPPVPRTSVYIPKMT